MLLRLIGHRVRRPRSAALAWLMGCAVLVAGVVGCSSGPLVLHAGAVHPVGSPGSGGSSIGAGIGTHTATAARGLRGSAELDVVSGASTISVAAASLGSELLRVTTPANSNVRPDLVVGGTGTVQVYLDGTGQGGPAAVQILLNSAVTWRLLLAGGASQTSVDLAGGRLAGADFAAGSSLISMRLPRPSGTVTVELAGGASQLALDLPAGVPAQLRLDGGASTADLLGHSYTGIAGGTVLTSPGWANAAARYLLYAPAGVSSVDVTG